MLPKVENEEGKECCKSFFQSVCQICSTKSISGQLGEHRAKPSTNLFLLTSALHDSLEVN